MRFTVACAQFAPKKADLEHNLDRIAELAIQASQEGADVVVYPETSTTGYFLEGGVLECALSAEDLHARLSQRLGGLERDVDLLVGFYESGNGDLHNSAAYLSFGEDARVRHVYRKFFLPTYGVFDEERFVARGRQLGLVQTRFGTMGILICEDVWHSVLPSLLALKGAQVVLVPSASPGRGFSGPEIGNHERYRRLLTAICEEHGVFGVNCQLTGFEGGKGFIGGSMVIDPFGKMIVEGPVIEEHLLLADIDLETIKPARAQTPLLSDLQSAWGDIRRLVEEV